MQCKSEGNMEDLVIENVCSPTPVVDEPPETHNVQNTESAENFQKFMYELFEKNGIINDLRAYLRGHIVGILRSSRTDEPPTCQKNFKQRLELPYQAINMLISEYLMRLEFSYTISVFVSEIPLGNMVLEFAKLLMKDNKNNTELRFKDEDVWSILNYLDIKCDSEHAANIVEMYKEDSQPLLLCMIKSMPLYTPIELGKDSSQECVLSSESLDSVENPLRARCTHLAFCKTCQEKMKSIKEKYRTKKNTLVKDLDDSIAKSLNMEPMMENIDVIERNLINEMFQQMKCVYEAELQMTRTEEEERVKRSLDSHAVQLQKKQLEMEERYKAREWSLSRGVAQKRRFLWGLTRLLQEQRSRLARAMTAVREENTRLAAKENSLKSQLAEAESVLRARGEEMRQQISAELVTLEEHLASMKRERDNINKEREEIERLKLLCDNSKRTNIEPNDDLRSHYDLLKNEFSILKKYLEASKMYHLEPKHLMERSTITVENVSTKFDTGLNNEQGLDRSRSEDRVKTKQVVNDFKKMKNVNFCQSVSRERSPSSRSQSTVSSEGDTHDATRRDALDETRQDSHDTRDASKHGTHDAFRHDTRDALRHDIHDASRHDTRDASRHESRDTSNHDTRDASRHDTRDALRHDTRDSSRHDTLKHDTRDMSRYDTSRHDMRDASKHVPHDASRFDTLNASRHETLNACRHIRDVSRHDMHDASRYDMHDASRYDTRDALTHDMLDASRHNIQDASRYDARVATPDNTRDAMRHKSRVPTRHDARGTTRHAMRDAMRRDYMRRLVDENERLRTFARQQRSHIEELSRQCRLQASPAARPPPARPHTAPAAGFGHRLPLGASSPCSERCRQGAGEEAGFSAGPPRVLRPGDTLPFIGVLRDERDSRRYLINQWRALRRRASPGGGACARERTNSAGPSSRAAQDGAHSAGRRASLEQPGNVATDMPSDQCEARVQSTETEVTRERTPDRALGETEDRSKTERSPSGVVRAAKLRLRKLELEAEAVERSYLHFRRQQSARRPLAAPDAARPTKTEREIQPDQSCVESTSRYVTSNNAQTLDDIDEYQAKYDIGTKHFKNKNITSNIVRPIPPTVAFQTQIARQNYLDTSLTEFRKYYYSDKRRNEYIPDPTTRSKQSEQPKFISPRLSLDRPSSARNRRNSEDDRPLNELIEIHENSPKNQDTTSETAIQNPSPNKQAKSPRAETLKQTKQNKEKELEILKQNISKMYNLSENTLMTNENYAEAVENAKWEMENERKAIDTITEASRDETCSETASRGQEDMTCSETASRGQEDKNLLRVEVESVSKVHDVKLTDESQTQDLLLVVESSNVVQNLEDFPEEIISTQMTILVSPKRSNSVKTQVLNNNVGKSVKISGDDVLNSLYHAEANENISSVQMQVDTSEVVAPFLSDVEIAEDPDYPDDDSADVDNFDSVRYESDQEYSPISMVKTSEDDNFWDS